MDWIKRDIVTCIRLAQAQPHNIDANAVAERLIVDIKRAIQHELACEAKRGYAQGRDMGIKEAFAEMRKQDSKV